MTFGDIPVWLLLLDYLLGMIMWTLIGRAALSLFLSDDTDWFFMKVFVRATNPILRIFKPITPGFLVEPMIPLFAAWFFYMTRFYVLPPLAGYGVMGMLSFPLESEIAAALYALFGQ